MSRSRCVLADIAVGVLVLCPTPALKAAPATSPEVFTTWQTFTQSDGLPGDGIRAIRVAGSDVWVGTDDGLALRRGDHWQAWTAKDGLPWQVIEAIEVDPRTKDVWLGTWGGGLVRFSGGRFDRFNQFNSGLAGDLVFAVAIHGGRIWASTNGGLSSFDPIRDTWDIHLERRADGPTPAITSLAGRDGNLLAAAWCDGIRTLDLADGTWTHSPGPSGGNFNRSFPPACAEDTTTAVTTSTQFTWSVTQTELSREDGTGRREARRIPGSGRGRRFISCIAARSDSEAWLGTDDGLLALADWNGDPWLNYQRQTDRAQSTVTLLADAKPRQIRVLNDGLPDNRVRCIAFDKDGIWVGTAAGLCRGSSRRPWSALAPVPDSDGARSMDNVSRAAASRAAPRHGTIAVLAQAVKTIALPGGATPAIGGGGRVDPWVVQLAVGGINARGGATEQSTVDVVVSNPGLSRYGWGLPEDDVPILAVQRGPAGMLGYLGPESRILSAVVLRTEVPLVNSASTPASSDELANPWIFRCRSNDALQQDAFMDAVLQSLGSKRLALLRTGGPISEMHLNAWAAHARARGCALVFDQLLNPEADDAEPLVESLRSADVAAVLTWCDAGCSATLLCRLRESGIDAAFVGSDEIACDDFVAAAGPDPGCVLAPAPCEHRRDTQARQRFVEQYRRAWPQRTMGTEPFLTFDAACHLLEAVQNAGSDREAVRETLRRMSVPRLTRLANGRWESSPIAGGPSRDPESLSAGSRLDEQRARLETENRAGTGSICTAVPGPGR